MLALPASLPLKQQQQKQQPPDSANHTEWAALPLLLFRPNNSFAAVAETVWRREGCLLGLHQKHPVRRPPFIPCCRVKGQTKRSIFCGCIICSVADPDPDP